MKQNRLERVIRGMEAMGLEQIIVSAPASVFYLTGTWVRPGERMLALYVHKSGEARLFANRLFALAGNVDAPLSEFDDTEDPIALLSQSVRPGNAGHRQILAQPLHAAADGGARGRALRGRLRAGGRRAHVQG